MHIKASLYNSVIVKLMFGFSLCYFQAVLDVLNFYEGSKYQTETNAKFMTVSKPYGR